MNYKRPFADATEDVVFITNMIQNHKRPFQQSVMGIRSYGRTVSTFQPFFLARNVEGRPGKNYLAVDGTFKRARISLTEKECSEAQDLPLAIPMINANGIQEAPLTPAGHTIDDRIDISAEVDISGMIDDICASLQNLHISVPGLTVIDAAPKVDINGMIDDICVLFENLRISVPGVQVDTAIAVLKIAERMPAVVEVMDVPVTHIAGEMKQPQISIDMYQEDAPLVTGTILCDTLSNVVKNTSPRVTKLREANKLKIKFKFVKADYDQFRSNQNPKIKTKKGSYPWKETQNGKQRKITKKRKEHIIQNDKKASIPKIRLKVTKDSIEKYAMKKLTDSLKNLKMCSTTGKKMIKKKSAF